MNDRAIDAHSVNCYFCAELLDERDSQAADAYNGGDGGSICANCAEPSVTGAPE